MIQLTTILNEQFKKIENSYEPEKYFQFISEVVKGETGLYFEVETVKKIFKSWKENNANKKH